MAGEKEASDILRLGLPQHARYCREHGPAARILVGDQRNLIGIKAENIDQKLGPGFAVWTCIGQCHAVTARAIVIDTNAYCSLGHL
jgi:hypothetical protein